MRHGFFYVLHHAHLRTADFAGWPLYVNYSKISKNKQALAVASAIIPIASGAKKVL